MNSNKLEMVKCAKFTYKYVPNKHMEKSINFPLKGLNGAWLLQQMVQILASLAGHFTANV